MTVQLAAKPMNGTDAALWEIERDPSLRTTVVSILTLDRDISERKFVAALDATSRIVPRLRQRVAEPPFGIGVPHWVLAENFDVRDHVVIHGPSRTDRAAPSESVLDIAAQASMTPFDRTRPLWECSYVGGLDPSDGFGSAVVIIKVHHSLADGVGGVALLDALLDPARRTKARDLSALPEYEPAPGAGVPRPPIGDALGALARVPVKAGRAAIEAAMHPLRTAASTAAAGSSAARLLAPSGDALSPLMTARGPDRELGVHDIDLDRLHDAASRHGCSINHLFFAGVLGGVAAYHREHASDVGELRVTMPVNFRRTRDTTGGNQWAPVRFRVPADIADPVERMLAIRSITTRSRDEPAIGFTHTLAGAVQLLPGALSSSVVAAMMRGVDLVLTNVPGLSEPRYLAGARVERMYPFAPLAGSACNAALLSHGQTACFGFAIDTAAVPDPTVLTELLAAGLDEAVREAETAEPAPPPTPPASAVAEPVTGPEPERLSALDESFLQIESETTPMHLGGLFRLDGDHLRGDDGELRIDDLRDHIAARLDRAPRYRERVAGVPFGQGRPQWVDDPDFDITDHVRTITLDAPGSDEQLRELVADLNAECLERDRPLWELWFVDGLAGGEIAMLQKVHHALADGVSSVALATALFDLEPCAEPDRPRPRTVARPPGPVRTLTDAWAEQLGDPIDLVRRAATTVTAAPGAMIAQTRSAVRGVRDLVGPGALAPASSLNQPVGPLRQIATMQLDFDEIDAVRLRYGGSANDVALTVLAGGLRTWLRAHDEPMPDLHALCPVSTHDVDGDGDDVDLGNHVGAMLIPLPLGEPDPARRLHIVRERTSRAKRRHDGEGVALALEAFDHLPHVAGAILRTALAHQPFVNLVVTNVPGPPQPLWFLDAPVRSIVPIVPLGPNTALGVALLSYDGVLHIGLHADPEHCADLDMIADAVLVDFARLSAVAPGV